MKKCIAFISDHASPISYSLGKVDNGGQNVYVDKITKELAKLNFEVDIFTRWENKKLPQIIEYSPGIRIIHIEAGIKDYIPKELIYAHMNQFNKNLLQFIHQTNIRYELIHANFWMSGMAAVALKKELHIPFVITFHALGKIRKNFLGKADKFPEERITEEEKIIKEADQIIAECPQDKEDLLTLYNAPQNKISIIPCGFDPNEFFPINKEFARKKIKCNKNDRIILQLGRIVPRKGIDTVISALSHLKNQHIKLIIVGGNSKQALLNTPEVKRLKNIAKKLGIQKNVIFIGNKPREELKYYYNSADIFVSTPWYEPFGITPLEAMACGTPVIGSSVGGVKFSVIDEKTGFLVEPNNPSLLAKKILELFNDPSRLEYFKKNSIQRVGTFFTWETVTHTLAALYEKIILFSNTEQHALFQESKIIDKNFITFIDTLKKSQTNLRIHMINCARIIARTINAGGKLLLCGNGGSASDAQHFAAELVGHFQNTQRLPLPALSLTADSNVITAISNDFTYDQVFSRQIEAYGNAGDVLVGISTSGNSQNLINAFKLARKKHIICISLLGKDGGSLFSYSDISLIVPSYDVQRIQEVHTHIIHSLCELIEKQIYIDKSSSYFEDAMIGLKNGKVSSKFKNIELEEKNE